MFLQTKTVSELGIIPSGAGGVMTTLKVMSRMVREGRKSFPVINKARGLVQSCQQKDYVCEATQLHRFVRDSIRYVQDPNDVELVQEPQKTLEFAAGDCDDKATLLASLLESIGHPTRFVAIGFRPGIYEHVYVETRIGDKWIPAETTEMVPLGWEPPREIVQARIVHFN